MHTSRYDDHGLFSHGVFRSSEHRCRIFSSGAHTASASAYQPRIRARRRIAAALVAGGLACGLTFAAPAAAQAGPLEDFGRAVVDFFTGGSGAESGDDTTAGDDFFAQHRVPTVSPAGTTINVFDYWDTEEHRNGGDFLGGGGDKTVKEGINTYSQLYFNQGECGNPGVSINSSSSERLALVGNRLGADGYPVLGGRGQQR